MWLTLYYTSGNIVLEREVVEMKKKDFLEKIKHQFDITLEVERSAKNWIYVYIKRTEQYKILPYLEKNKIRYEKHLDDGFFIIL